MYRLGILIMSDKGSRGEREDLAGLEIRRVLGAGFTTEYYEIVPDEEDVIIERLKYACDELRLDLVLTSGGTGFSSRDLTPEASMAVIERVVPGIPEAMRALGREKTTRSMLSRAVAGIRGKTLIINLPGSVKGVRESLEAIMDALPHGLDILKGEASECGQK